MNLGNLQPLTVTGSSELPAFLLCLEVEGCRFVAVSYYLPCYMGHICGICGLQCYDHLGRICAVLKVKKNVDNFPVDQGS